nr:S-adenosylmethionine carrier 1, chloroplastic/mitochondrial [Tanacetum cinerariifolium]
EKNGKWSCIYAVGSQEYQMVCMRPDIASTYLGMLDGFDRGLQTYVQVFVDFDYAMGRSITRYGFMILGCTGSLKANLQHMKALPTTEVGYMTFTEAWKKKMWLKGLLTKSRYELRLVAGIATGALVKGGSRSEVPAQVEQFGDFAEGFIARGTAGVVVETALYPIDVINTSQQAARGGGNIVLQEFYSGLAENLVSVLPKGYIILLLALLLLSSALFVGVYEPTKNKLLKILPNKTNKSTLTRSSLRLDLQDGFLLAGASTLKHVTLDSILLLVGNLRELSNKSNNAELKLFLEVEVGQDLQPIPPPAKTKEEILLLFKYDPVKESSYLFLSIYA